MNYLKNKKLISGIIAGIVIVAALIVLIIVRADGEKQIIKPVISSWGDENEALEVLQTDQAYNVTDNWSVVDNQKYGFKFKYPSVMKVGNFPVEDGEMLVVQDIKNKVGFQIFMQKVDQNINMTSERIKQDIKDVRISDPQPIVFEVRNNESGKKNSEYQGLAFMSDNDSFAGKSREIWFTHKGILYQVSTYAHLDPLMQKVMGSWEFYR